LKGTMFDRPLEYTLNVSGERWRQGDKVQGALIIKNHSNESFKLSGIKLSLASGEYKDVRKGNAEGLVIEKDILFLQDVIIAASDMLHTPWEFQLKDDCNITDKSGGYFLAYGAIEANKVNASLELCVDVIEPIDQFITIFENFFRFKATAKKYKKGHVEIKFSPPGASKEMSAVEALTCDMRLNDKNLEIKYNFKLKKLIAGGVDVASVKVERQNKFFEQRLSAKEYSSWGGAPNQEIIIVKIKEVLREVVPKIIY